MTTALDAVDGVIRAKVQSWSGMLSFTASPTITPKIGPVPTEKRASLDRLTAYHAQNSDGTNFGVG